MQENNTFYIHFNERYYVKNDILHTPGNFKVKIKKVHNPLWKRILRLFGFKLKYKVELEPYENNN